ncbi:MAG TPA: LCP family protein [Gaiellaceae bacterium]|jgi:LCP family protein required for cell wall assembly
MRTTLKRGTTGHGAGNGHGGTPLAPLTAATRYRTRRRGPLRLIGKFFFWLVVVVLVAVGALGGGAWLYINQSVAAVRAHSPELIAAQEDLDVAQANQPTVALVIGYDKRTGPESSIGSRSDTIMLLRADPQKKVITMLSFPRDLIVNIPGCKGQGPFSGRINEAYTYCGPRGTLRTVKDLTHVPINYIITVNFIGFQDIVDKLGGVYLDIDHRYFNDNSSGAPSYATIDLHSGYQRLTGGQALTYVRFRHTDSDLYRVVRQQNFVKAMKQQVATHFSVTTIPGIVKTITKNVEVGVGGGKSLDVQTLYGYANLIYGLPSGNFQQVQIGDISGYNELSAPQSAVDNAVNDFMNPDVSAPQKAATAALGEKPKAESGPRPSQVSVEVLNGNGIAGAADDAAVKLSQRGYPVVNGGNADKFNYFQTKILYDPAVAGAQAAAKQMADLFGDGEAEVAPPRTKLRTMLQVIVGQTFHGDLTPGPADQTPTHAAPTVTADTYAAAQLRTVKKRAGFPLYTPTVRDSSSTLSTLEPVREYKIGDHKAVRLVYETGNEYWGIQELEWEDPPILDGASVQKQIKGRNYGLYFDGPKLHMVAFKENGDSYYVINTLLNRLSNETMLAIAKGLKPLR